MTCVLLCPAEHALCVAPPAATMTDVLLPLLILYVDVLHAVRAKPCERRALSRQPAAVGGSPSCSCLP